MERQRAEGQFFSGEGLLKRLEHHIGKLDLIFLDMEMGELAGTEIARRLRSANPGLHLVFVTGYADRIFGGYLAIRVRNSLAGSSSCMDWTPWTRTGRDWSVKPYCLKRAWRNFS